MSNVVLAGVNRDPSAQAMEAAVRQAAERASDFGWLSHGDSVFIKPAFNSGMPYPATTHPVAVAAMIKLLFEKGAGRVIVGDMAGIRYVKLSPQGASGSTRRLMEATGMAQAAQAAGAELHFFEEAGWNAFYEDAPLAGSHWSGALMMPNILKESEHIVLMPRCSRHVLAGCSLGLKAAVGYWRTDTRLEYHRDAATFAEKTAEGNSVATLMNKQRLAVSAADKLLTTFGPDRGRVAQPEIGLVIASPSVVAHDMVSLAWLLENSRSAEASLWDRFIDTGRLPAEIGNRWVVKLLGGWRAVLAEERLVKREVNSVWDDPALARACEVLGGRPRVQLESANALVPSALMQRLGEMLTPIAS